MHFYYWLFSILILKYIKHNSVTLCFLKKVREEFFKLPGRTVLSVYHLQISKGLLLRRLANQKIPQPLPRVKS